MIGLGILRLWKLITGDRAFWPLPAKVENGERFFFFWNVVDFPSLDKFNSGQVSVLDSEPSIAGIGFDFALFFVFVEGTNG